MVRYVDRFVCYVTCAYVRHKVACCPPRLAAPENEELVCVHRPLISFAPLVIISPLFIAHGNVTLVCLLFLSIVFNIISTYMKHWSVGLTRCFNCTLHIIIMYSTIFIFILVPPFTIVNAFIFFKFIYAWAQRGISWRIFAFRKFKFNVTWSWGRDFKYILLYVSFRRCEYDIHLWSLRHRITCAILTDLDAPRVPTCTTFSALRTQFDIVLDVDTAAYRFSTGQDTHFWMPSE